MAYVDFQQAPGMPEGAGYFTTDMGQKTPLVFLPQEAAKLQQPQPDLRTAEAGPQSFDSLAGLAGGAKGAVPPSVADVAGAGRAPPPAPLGQQFAPPPTAPVGNAHSAPPPIGAPITPKIQAPEPAVGGGPDTAVQTPPNDMALARQFVAPSPGAGAGTSHFQKSLTHEVTPSLSPENMAATKQALQASADTQAENLKRESDTQAHLAVNKSIEASIARDDQEQARQREVKARDAQAGWDNQWQAAMKEDPADVFHGNVFAHALSILGQAMGAYGASITHTENWAAKAYEKLVDNNVKVQMAKRQGLYQRMRDAGADAEQAANAVRAASYEAIAREAEQQAAQSKSDQARGQATQVAVDVRKLQQVAVNENALAEQGKTSVTTAQSGSSGGAGGDRVAAMVKRREQWIKLGRDPAEFDKAAGFAEGKGEESSRTAAEQRIKGPAETVLDGLDRFGPVLGMTRNKDGSWNPPPLTKVAQAHGAPGTDEWNARKSMIHALAPEIATVRKNGAAATEPEIKDVQAELSTLSPQQLANTFNGITERAHKTISQRIYHGKNQVPGDNGEGQ